MIKENVLEIKDLLCNKRVMQLITTLVGVFLTVFGVVMFNRYALMQFSLVARMFLMIISQWLIMIVPIILMWINKENALDIFVIPKNIGKQIIVGILIALGMSLVLTVIPILAGLKEMIGSTSYTHPWQFIYTFIHAIIGVSLAEEFVFRGYLFQKLLEIKDSRWFAIIASSVLFGLFHIFNGNIIQVVMTTFLGLLFCLAREKIKDCTFLSLVVAHGVYDGLIVLWISLL